MLRGKPGSEPGQGIALPFIPPGASRRPVLCPGPPDRVDGELNRAGLNRNMFMCEFANNARFWAGRIAFGHGIGPFAMVSLCDQAIEKALAILKHLREGCETRVTGRLVDVDKNTVTRYLAKAGGNAERLHDELVALPPPDP